MGLIPKKEFKIVSAAPGEEKWLSGLLRQREEASGLLQ